jgi:hypothetical protein
MLEYNGRCSFCASRGQLGSQPHFARGKPFGSHIEKYIGVWLMTKNITATLFWFFFTPVVTPKKFTSTLVLPGLLWQFMAANQTTVNMLNLDVAISVCKWINIFSSKVGAKFKAADR